MKMRSTNVKIKKKKLLIISKDYQLKSVKVALHSHHQSLTPSKQ